MIGRTQQAAWWVLVVLCLAVEIAIAGHHQYRARAPLRELESDAILATAAPGQELDSATTLDASNAILWPGPWRDLEVRGSAELEPLSILEVRVRTPSKPDPVGTSARGVALFVSADPRFSSGLYLEDSGRFQPLALVEGPEFEISSGPGHSADVSFLLAAEGDDFVAEIVGPGGDRLRLRARSDRFPGGGVEVLIARGRGAVSKLQVTPAAAPAGEEGLSAPGWANPVVVRAALAPASLALLLAVVAVVLLGARWVVGFTFGALAALPLIAALGVLDPLATSAVGSSGPWPAVAVCGSLLIALILPLSRPGQLTFLRLIAFGVVAGGGAIAAQKPMLRPAPWPPDVLALNHLSYLDWPGDRIDADLLPLVHPLLRRFNFTLADHRFRGRRFPVSRTSGVARVLCLGTSSTWGLGVSPGEDYPTVLERLLNQVDPAEGVEAGYPVEVINAGVCGSVGHRLVRILEHHLLEFAPDLIVLNLRYNDGAVLCGPDEAEYLQRITAPGHSRSALGDFRDRFAQQAGVRAFDALRLALVAGEPLEWPADRGPSPASRFETTLRRFADLARARDIGLIFVIEPLNARWFFADALAAATRRVAEEYGLAVVDPSAAIRREGGPALFLDTVHPNPAGHLVIAAELDPVVRSALGR